MLVNIYEEIKKSQKQAEKRLLWLHSMGFETYVEYYRSKVKWNKLNTT